MKLLDKIFAQDKREHFEISFILVIVLYYFCCDLLVATVAVFQIGVLKESYDEFANYRWSWGDLLADLVGIILAILIVIGCRI